MTRHLPKLLALLAAAGVAVPALAAPYASGIRNTAGSTYEFVLNEAADSVTVLRDGGNEVDLGALSAGRHTFDLGGFSTFDINVARSAPAGFTAVDDSANLFTSFDRPGGLAVNTIPTSPYFGTVYVNQVRSESGGAPVVTAGGRTMGNGIYSLTADRQPVNLTDFSIPVDPSDTSLAKAPGIMIDAASASSMYRIGMDDAGNIIASDWSDTTGGLKYLTADLTSGGPLLRQEGNFGTDTVAFSDDQDEFGDLPLHGSINGTPQASGTLGVDLVVSAMDEDMDVDLSVPGDDGNSVWQWNVGSTVGDYAGAPSLVADVGSLTTSTGAASGQDSSGTPIFLNLNVGVTANAQYNAHFDKWYLSGSRSNGDDSSSLVILTPEGAGGDGEEIVVDWASHQFSIDNGLDGYTDDELVANSLDPANDIFRQVHNVAFSPDNTMMYVQRRVVHSTNPVLGTETDLGTTILGVPLDENGLPIIEIDDNGTPGDTSDDTITNLIPISTAKNPGAQGSWSAVEVDAAGNLFFTDNVAEGVEYISLGGSTVATTSNNAGLTAGAFSLVTAEPVAGDYNGDGAVDAADYTVWRDTLGSTTDLRADGNGNGAVDPADYTVWTGNYGSGSSTSSAVPEPAALAMLAMGLGLFASKRTR